MAIRRHDRDAPRPPSAHTWSIMVFADSMEVCHVWRLRAYCRTFEGIAGVVPLASVAALCIIGRSRRVWPGVVCVLAS
eukprot:XP_001689738.1 predicted protein [Chlamydomonas reinhardtii]